MLELHGARRPPPGRDEDRVERLRGGGDERGDERALVFVVVDEGGDREKVLEGDVREERVGAHEPSVRDGQGVAGIPVVGVGVGNLAGGGVGVGLCNQ